MPRLAKRERSCTLASLKEKTVDLFEKPVKGWLPVYKKINENSQNENTPGTLKVRKN